MSLTKQLWLAIACITVMAFGTSLMISSATSHAYLIQQLHLKNMDNAASLALALSQMPKDPTTLELMLSAQFDTGHYQHIELVSAAGEVLIERTHALPDSGAPSWFVKLIPLEAPPGLAQIQDGWHQFGTLKVESHTHFAYAALWEGMWRMLISFVGGAAVFGLIATLILHRIIKPLHAVVSQAKALGGRRFITTAEPRTTEFRALVRAMNTLSERMRRMFTEEAARVEELRRKLQHDSVSGLLNRDQFIRNFGTRFLADDSQSSGSLAIVRICQLAELNKQAGHAQVDEMIHLLAARLLQISDALPGSETGRLNGSDMALLVPEPAHPNMLIENLRHELDQLALRTPLAGTAQFALAAVAFASTESERQILSRLDSALAAAEVSGEAQAIESISGGQLPSYTSLQEWKQALQTALDAKTLKLDYAPVLSPAGKVLHYEGQLCVQLDGVWYNAATVIPWATRASLAEEFDLHATFIALDHIASQNVAVSITLSTSAIVSASFQLKFIALLKAQPHISQKLWVEVAEYGVVQYLDAFRTLCRYLRRLKCRIGIEHAGRQFNRLGGLQEIGLDYVKIDASFTRGVADSRDLQSVARGLCALAHAIGLDVYAQGVSQHNDLPVLIELGFDGLTGLSVQENGASQAGDASP